MTNAAMPGATLSREQKQQLYRDGGSPSLTALFSRPEVASARACARA